MAKCELCKNKKKVKNLVEHMKREHIGKLSRQSYEYLKSLGIKDLDKKLGELGIEIKI